MHASIKLIMCTLKAYENYIHMIHSSYVLICNIKALLNSVATYIIRITSIVCICSFLFRY